MVKSLEAIYDEDASERAERAFYVRSVWQLRRFMTFAPAFKERPSSRLSV
jgi:hypothetical protein